MQDLVKETKELKVIYRTSKAEFVVELEYRPQIVTLGFLDEIATLDTMGRLVYQIEKLVAKWDLQDDDGEIIPVTEEAIRKSGIPIYLMNSIVESITKDRMLFTNESKKD